MAAENAIVCDAMPYGLRAGHMSSSPGGVRTWHPAGSVVAIPDGPGRLRLAADAEVTIDMQSFLGAWYRRLP
jgi:hypothetical protein